ncbi:hypothetical protein GJAV_G00065640 [Gymnothorax javanicus]|nr:hypothetical protein GJAV_G00065640 [Gymnothorax javanicus]
MWLKTRLELKRHCRKCERVEAMKVQRKKLITLLIIAAIMDIVVSEEMSLDMGPNAVDDQYLGCREKMLEKVLSKGGLLDEERAANEVFSKAWDSTKCSTLIPSGRTEHSQALALYTHESHEFHQAFQDAVRSQGWNVTAYQRFPFKALHFLLVDAMQILRPKKCEIVYHESKLVFQTSVGDKVRFGMFTSALSEKSAEEAHLLTNDEGTVFNITSCAVVSVDEPACYPEESDRLIPPFEEFRVMNITNTGHRRLIFLNHSRLYSYHNCLLFPSSSYPVSPNMLLLLTASLCLCCYCLGLKPL